MQFFTNTHIDFLSKRKTFFFVSFVMVVGGLIASLLVGVDLGIDFTGGTEVVVRFENPVEVDELRTNIANSGVEGFELKSFEADNEFLIRLQQSRTEDAGQDKLVSEVVVEELRSVYGGSSPETAVEVRSVQTIGPTVGEELKFDAAIAVLLSVLAILAYVAFRFEFVFALGAIVALVHDICIAFALAVLMNKLNIINLEINQGLIAAFLTVLGFSINNTVIIFDRIRENRELHKNQSFVPLVNLSINDTLSRTVNTFLTTALALFTIVLFGGPVLQGFAFTMLVGFIAGTYSSIYISSSFVVWYLENVKKQDVYGSSDKVRTKSAKLARV